VNCYELTSKFTSAETGRNMFLTDLFKPRFKPPSAETCQACFLVLITMLERTVSYPTALLVTNAQGLLRKHDNIAPYW